MHSVLKALLSAIGFLLLVALAFPFIVVASGWPLLFMVFLSEDPWAITTGLVLYMVWNLTFVIWAQNKGWI